MLEINLLPWREGLYRQQLKIISWIYVIAILIAILGLLSTHLIIMYQTNKLQNEFSLLKNKVKSSSSFSEINEEKHKITYGMLNALFHLHTSGLHLVEVAQQDDVMLVSGSATSEDAVSEFMSDLIATHLIHAVKLVSSRHEQDQIQFQVQVLE